METIVTNLPSRQEIIDLAWAMENPNNRALRSDGYYEIYPDPNGKDWNVGPGLLVGTTVPRKAKYTRQELDDAAYKFGLDSLSAIGKAFNEHYGNEQNPDPWNSVDSKLKLLMLDTRYQNGSVPQEKWPNLYDAVYKNDIIKALQQSRATFENNGVKKPDNDRVRRRVAHLFPSELAFSIDKKTQSPVIYKIAQAKKKGGKLFPKRMW